MGVNLTGSGKPCDGSIQYSIAVLGEKGSGKSTLLDYLLQNDERSVNNNMHSHNIDMFAIQLNVD